MITGAAGLVGSALAEAWRSHEVFALRHDDLDITSRDAVDRTVVALHPDVIFNCAVIGVDECETDPALAERVNVIGPEYLASAAQRTGAAMVHFSSNYVFGNERRSGIAYAAEDEARPVNVYGVTKLAGERAVSAAAERAFVVRTSWVFGERKASFLSTVAARLARGERVQAISDTFCSSTYVVDLVSRVQEVLERATPGVYQIVNAGVCSYLDFAREAARLVGASEDLIDVVTEESLGRIAPRPRWTPMQCLPPMRSWQEALAAYVGSKK